MNLDIRDGKNGGKLCVSPTDEKFRIIFLFISHINSMAYGPLDHTFDIDKNFDKSD